MRHGTDPRRARLGIEHTTVEVDGKHMSAMKLTCTNGCGTSESIVINKSAAALPDNVVLKKFTQQGWEIRAGGTKRICPSCVAKKHVRQPRVLTKETALALIESVDSNFLQNPETSHEIVPDTGQPSWHRFAYPPTDVTPAQRAEAESLIAKAAVIPKVIHKEAIVPENNIRTLAEVGKVVEPDKDTKRRIFRAIDDNWDDSRGRYLANHSDQFISEDLKVPRIWVERIRIENFGESGGNEAIEEFKVQLEGYIKDVDRLKENAFTMAQGFEKASNELKDMRRRLERIELSVLPRGR